MKSLAHAAEALHVSAPALTHSLQHLEESFGQKLCERSKSHFKLTSFGEKIYQWAQSIEKEYTQSVMNTSVPNHLNTNTFGIALLPDFKNKMLSKALAEFTIEFPEVYLNVQTCSANEMAGLIRTGEFDVALSIFKSKDETLTYKEIHVEFFEGFIKKSRLKNQTRSIRIDPSLLPKNKVHDGKKNIQLPFEMNQSGFAHGLNSAHHILESGHAAVFFPDWYHDRLEPEKYVKLKKYGKVRGNSICLLYDPRNCGNPLLDFFVSRFN